MMSLSKVFLTRYLKRRLQESEEERKILQDKLLTSQKDWEAKISSHNSALLIKQQQRLKHLETFGEEQGSIIKNLETQLRNSLMEREKLASKLADKDHRLEEGGSDNENFILRREMDNLLKEKIYLSSENSDLKRKLNVFDDHHISGFNEDRSHSLNKSNTNRDKSGIKDRDSFMTKPITEEDLELRNKVLAYFGKRYPRLSVAQINRSKKYLK